MRTSAGAASSRKSNSVNVAIAAGAASRRKGSLAGATGRCLGAAGPSSESARAFTPACKQSGYFSKGWGPLRDILGFCSARNVVAGSSLNPTVGCITRPEELLAHESPEPPSSDVIPVLFAFAGAHYAIAQ